MYIKSFKQETSYEKVPVKKRKIINPFNELSHPYTLDESIFIFRGVKSNFSFLFNFTMNPL